VPHPPCYVPWQKLAHEEPDMSHALIVIDVQNDFCPGGALAVTDGDAIVDGINALMGQVDAVVLTRIGIRRAIPPLRRPMRIRCRSR
jgi:nicotinamidase/pyrazinamidase